MGVMKFRKKAEEVDAIQFANSGAEIDNANEVISWILEKGGVGVYATSDNSPVGDEIRVFTSMGIKTATRGMYIVLDDYGNFDAVEAEWFERRFEAII